jgi:hypothetical protein
MDNKFNSITKEITDMVIKDATEEITNNIIPDAVSAIVDKVCESPKKDYIWIGNYKVSLRIKKKR